tara:strand:- start:30 stop:488 length:459 start_codon:yes stop_codon:yes gene_type:complete
MAFNHTIAGLNILGNTLINSIKADLQSQGKSASGELIEQTKFTVRTGAFGIRLEATAPSYYTFVDKGVNGTAVNHGSPYSFKGKFANIGAIRNWINIKGIDASPFAVARSVASKGFKKTDIYTNAVKEAKSNLNGNALVRQDIESSISKLIK